MIKISTMMATQSTASRGEAQSTNLLRIVSRDSTRSEIAELKYQLRVVTEELERERKARRGAEIEIRSLLEQLETSAAKVHALENAYMPLKADYRAMKEDKIARVKELDELGGSVHQKTGGLPFRSYWSMSAWLSGRGSCRRLLKMLAYGLQNTQTWSVQRVLRCWN
jgi:septation ring formation regulator EzrA